MYAIADPSRLLALSLMGLLGLSEVAETKNAQIEDKRFGWMSNDYILPPSDKLPLPSAIQFAGNIPLQDAVGRVRLFKDLYLSRIYHDHRQLFIFIKHIACTVGRSSFGA